MLAWHVPLSWLATIADGFVRVPDRAFFALKPVDIRAVRSRYEEGLRLGAALPLGFPLKTRSMMPRNRETASLFQHEKYATPNPKVRAAALWTAHSLLATGHIAAADRPSGRSTQDRQTALLSAVAPAGRHWLAQRQVSWPPEYRRVVASRSFHRKCSCYCGKI
jgi:hypothetical protein